MPPQAKFSTCTDSEDQPSPLNELHEATEPSTEISTPSPVATRVGIAFGKTPIYITPRTTTHHGPTPSVEAREYTTTRSSKNLDHEHFSTPASFVLEPRRSPKPHTSAPVSPGGVVPRQKWPDFASVHHSPSTLLTRPSAASATAPATTRSVLDDGMPDLPPLPTPVVGILIVLTLIGFAATILVYLLTFPPPREGYFGRLKQKFIRCRSTVSAYELQRLHSNNRDNIYLSSDDEDDREYYSRVSPSTGTSTAYFSPHTPASPFLRTRAPPPPTEAEWLARRRAFDTDEEALTPTMRGMPSNGSHSPLLGTPPMLARRSASYSYAYSPTADASGSEVRNRKRRPEIKSWLSSIDGVVDRAIGSAARYLSDDGEGEGEFRFPVTQ
ncbi:hypothetical protein H2199_006239 [Coniosporium tulheliwenetii]|uniref:Uncharacterized protein n=1 Tax=Coniosporium tulheliwenetii TaxID=3383036 RepID=A0ACC2YX53_9PEZI|nr:hypothetical protein H2199_006239 [Cladosporium sp. JES 115]